jgi:hypothetical protein
LALFTDSRTGFVMWDLLARGGWIATGPMTILAAVNVILVVRYAWSVVSDSGEVTSHGLFGVNSILHIGVFCLFLGLLAQAVGLYQALSAIEAASDISPAIIWGGLKVSLIAPIYGAMIFGVSAIAWFFLRPSRDVPAA